MENILISIQPQWVEKILNGEKTIEIRKTMPKCKLPCNVYIYESKGREFPFNVRIDTIANHNESRYLDCQRGMPPIRKRKGKYGEVPYIAYGKMKVVAKFTLNKVDYLGNVATDKWEYLTGDCHEYAKHLVFNACLTETQILKYKGKYAWHIDDLIIYDKPKELNEFRYNDCEFCKHIKIDAYDTDNRCCWAECHNIVKRPPQSWCYIDKMED